MLQRKTTYRPPREHEMVAPGLGKAMVAPGLGQVRPQRSDIDTDRATPDAAGTT